MCPATGLASASSGSSRCCSSSSSSSAYSAGGGEGTAEAAGTGRATATRSRGSTAGTSRRTARRRPKLVISRSRTSPVYKERGREGYPLPAPPPEGGRYSEPHMKQIVLVDDEPRPGQGGRGSAGPTGTRGGT